MTFNPFRYLVLSLLVSLTTCIFAVLCAFQLYGNEDYVHNYLGHTANSDTGAIPIASYILVSIFFAILHIVAHLSFYKLTRYGKLDRDFGLKLGFYKNERKINWAIRIVFYLLTAYSIKDYIESFYKFYIFEFLFYLFIILALIVYSLTITNLIESKRIKVRLEKAVV